MSRADGLRRITVVLVALVLVWGNEPGSADTTELPDPLEQYHLDIVTASQGHDAGSPRVLIHRVGFAEAWSNESLPYLELKLTFTRLQDKRTAVVYVSPRDDGSLRALFLDQKGTKGHGDAWRPDDHTLQIEFARGLLGRRIDGYRWRVEVAQPCEGKTNCAPEWDFAPDRAQPKARHDL